MVIDTVAVAGWLQRNYYEAKGFSTGHSRTRANKTSSALNGLTPETLDRVIFANGGLRSNLLGVAAEVLVGETVCMMAPSLNVQYSPLLIDRIGADLILQFPDGGSRLHLGIGVKLQKTPPVDTLNAVGYPEMPVVHVAIGQMGRGIMKEYFLSLFDGLVTPQSFLVANRGSYQAFFCDLANGICRGLDNVNSKRRPNLVQARDAFMGIFSQKVVGEVCD
ncbi:hypothetical protein KC660_02090 [Candidatus Dojkabacteria bacterium]|uniref:Uncharacterized protein n=1 Tax=Candidatus Dojkabacteria bacterium TaxID=2099670 RepID=A0A955L3C1_9BACT|nr:hypothetical protein [Candidatus Dojkabacteria bacterium]